MLISPFVFFFFLLMTYYLLFILDYRNDIRQKANLIFYSSSKLVVKQQRQLATSTMHLMQELLMNIQCGGDIRSFAKMRALKMNGVLASHWKLTMTNWEHHRS